MNDPTTHNTAPHRTGTKEECCTELKCESGLRNNYFDGKRLTTDSFRVEQKYMLDRRHLVNRAIHGWGVVYGYRVGPAESDARQGETNRLEIGAGFALDQCGRELLHGGTKIRYQEVIFLDEQGKRIEREKEVERLSLLQAAAGPAGNVGTPSHGYSGAQEPPTDVSDVSKKRECWLLRVHYAERDTAHVRIEDQCRCEHDEWDHTCETVRYSVQRTDCEKCCDAFDCELTCDCVTGPCCDDKHMRLPSGVHQRGGCQCLCQHLTKLPQGGECDALCEIEESCGSVRVDLKNGVPLACVELVSDNCGGLAFGRRVESCGPRRLVKRNDLLFDLIRGCDLTRITDFGWKAWHRQSEPISFEAFAAAFGQGNLVEPGYVTKDFWVKFSRPVRRDTVRRDCFVMTIITAERDDGWWETLRVPIVRVQTADTDLVERATIVVDGPWIRDTVKGAASLFQGKVTRVELEVRGDFIVDCNGQPVDANAIGRSPVPTGNGTPGGTLLSTFLVGPAPTPSHPASYYSEDRSKGVS